MKNLNLYILGVIAMSLSACSTNQDLATLNEYDDVYYQGSRTAVASTAPVAVNDNNLDGASEAERSYYQNEPYTESTAKEQSNSNNTDSDYYDENYANRIDNFHRPNDGDYMYTSPQSTSPSLSYNMGFGMGSYGSGMSFGMNYGYPGYGGYGMGMYNSMYMGYSPYAMSPWYSPYYARPYYGYGYGYSPYYDPFYPRYGYGYGGYYGGYYPPYYGGGVSGGDYYGGSSGITSTPRQNTGAVRPSRGGVITQGSNNDGGRSGMAPNSTNKETDLRKATVGDSERSTQTELRRKDVQNREDLTRNVSTQPSDVRDSRSNATREYTRPGTTRSDYIRSEQATRPTSTTTIPSRSTVPNTTPSRVTVPSRSQDSRSLSPATRSRSGNVSPNSGAQPSRSYTSPTRTRSTAPSHQQRNMSPRQSAPSRSYSSPAPTRSSGGSYGGGGGGTTSPASTPSRGSRR